MAHEKVLIVDDDQSTLTACSVALRTEGYQITTASSGEEAIELCKKRLNII